MMQLVQDHIEKIKPDYPVDVLDLSNAGLFDDAIEKLVELLQAYKSQIDILKLDHNNISEAGLTALSKLTTVKEIILSHNNLKDGKQLEDLVSNPKIRKLDLSCNNLTDNAAEIIIKYSQQIELNINGNEISAKNRQKIQDRLDNNSKMEMKKILGL